MNKPLIDKAIRIALANGYQVYLTDARPSFYFAHLITPDGNILVIQNGNFGGLFPTFNYVPSKENGTGCACREEEIYDISLETLKELEEEGLAFAKRLGAKLYSSPEEWLKGSFRDANRKKIESEDELDISGEA